MDDLTGTLLAWVASLSSPLVSFGVITAWTIAGVLLLALGWWRLPRRPPAPFHPGSRRRGQRGTRAAFGSVIGVAATSGVAAIGLLLGQFGVIPWSWSAGFIGPALALLVAVAAVAGATAGLLSSSSVWVPSGIAAWTGLALLAAGFLGYTVVIIAEATTMFAQVVGFSLLLLEVFGLAIALAYQFYALESIAGRITSPVGTMAKSPGYLPVVAVQMACYNEPPQIVEEALDSIRSLNYPPARLRVQLLDDSTDPAAVDRLARFCERRGVDFFHRRHRRGFKGGALNDGLARLPAEVELVAVVDADYLVQPDFLTRVVPSFSNPRIGFVQTPQSYRNVEASRFGHLYALADAYFYEVVQPVRARSQSAIFCGTMGVVRRKALEEVGGWSEGCVTEDAELSIRLLGKGYSVEYLPCTLGSGLAPASMDGVRSQHRRWAYGGVQMLRINRRLLRSTSFTRRQRTDFRLGGLFWCDGIFLFGMAFTLAAVAVGSWIGLSLPSPILATLAITSSAAALLLWDSIVKLRLGLGRTRAVSYREVVGVMGLWYALKLNDLRAALRGRSRIPLAFVRTPKIAPPTPPDARLLLASLRATWAETLGCVCLLGVAGLTLYLKLGSTSPALTVATAVLVAWLVYYAVVLATPLALDYSSRRHPATLSDDVPIAPRPFERSTAQS